MAEARKGLLQILAEFLEGVRQRAFAARALEAPAAPSAAKEAVDRIAVPNQQPASFYSTEEILRGRTIEFQRALEDQAEKAKAAARYTDLENKFGMRPGIDGVRVTFRSGPR